MEKDFTNPVDLENGDATAEQLREGINSASQADAESLRDSLESQNSDFNDFDFDDDGADDLSSFSFGDSDDFVDPRLEASDEEDLDVNLDEDLDEEEEGFEQDLDSTEFNDDDLDDYIVDPAEDDVQSVDSSNLSDDELIQRLKDKGYNISEPEDKNSSRVNQIDMLDRQVNSLKSILSGSEDNILKEGLKLQLQQQYKAEGREKDINSEDFQDDLEDQITGLDLNTVLRSTILNGFKRDLAFVIQQKEGQRNQIQTEHKTELDNEVRQVREQTKQSVTNLSKEYGMNLSQAKEVWNFITSGELAKITNDPNFVARAVIAELAARKGQKLFSKDDSYARGVADTLAEFEKNKDATKVQRSLLGKQISGRETGLSATSSKNPWMSNLYVDEEEYEKTKPKKQPQRAAGQM